MTFANAPSPQSRSNCRMFFFADPWSRGWLMRCRYMMPDSVIFWVAASVSHAMRARRISESVRVSSSKPGLSTRKTRFGDVPPLYTNEWTEMSWVPTKRGSTVKVSLRPDGLEGQDEGVTAATNRIAAGGRRQLPGQPKAR